MGYSGIGLYWNAHTAMGKWSNGVMGQLVNSLIKYTNVLIPFFLRTILRMALLIVVVRFAH